MPRIRLTVGGGAPVRGSRPASVFAAGFAVRGRAALQDGTLGACAIATTATLTATPQQGFGASLVATFLLRAVPRFKMDGQAPFAMRGAAGTNHTLFDNGYAVARRLVRAAQPDLAAESTTDLPSLIDTTEVPGDWSWLLTGSPKRLSGLVGGFPADVRFETEGGTKLDHQWVSYDGTAGAARWFVREPAGSSSGADLRVLVYYGKAGVVATEANVAGVWQGAALVIDPTSGADLTGKGHGFTRSGTITNTTLDGRPAIQVADQTGGLLRRQAPGADVTFTDTLAALTEEFWAKIGTASSGAVSRLGGDPLSAQKNARFSTWAEHTGSAGGKADVLQSGANWWNGATQPNESTESIAGIADGSTVRHIIVVRQSNQHTQLYDGETNVSSTDYANSPSAGTIHPRSDDNYSLGAGTGTQDTSPAMTLGLYVLWPKALSATWRAMLDRTQRDSSLAWAVGAEDTYHNVDSSPVGKPWRDSITAQTDYDLTTHAFDPDAGASVVATAVTQPTVRSADYSIQSGKLRASPHAGASGVDRPVVTLSDGTKTAKVSPRITVTGGGASAEGIAPAFVQPASGNIILVPGDMSLPAAIGSATAGKTVLVAPGTYAGSLTFSKNGTAANPIIFRAGHMSGGSIVDDILGVTLTGAVTLGGDYNWLRGFRLTDHFDVPSGTSKARLNRCRMTGHTCTDYGTGTSVDWCEFTAIQAEFLQPQPVKGMRSHFTYRSWFHHQAPSLAQNAGTHVSVGQGYKDEGILTRATGSYHLECLFGPDDVAGEGLELKADWCVAERCATISAGGTRTVRSTIRHGDDNVFVGCVSDRGKLIARGRRNRIVDCTGGGEIGSAIGDITIQQFIDLQGGTPGANYPNGENTILTRIRNPVVGVALAGTHLAPTGTILEDCTGTVTTDWGGSFPGYTTRAASAPYQNPYPKSLVTWRSAAAGGKPAQVGPLGVYDAAD